MQSDDQPGGQETPPAPGHLPKTNEQPQKPPVPNDLKTQPPESTFKKLAPSRNRYTILRDEL